MNMKLIMRTFLVVGAIFIIVGFGAVYSRAKFINDSILVAGKVVDVKQSIEEDGQGSTFRPEVVFYTKEGEQLSFISEVGSDPPAYKSGDVVNVLYNSINPHNAEINSFFSLWFLQLVLVSMGIIFVSISAVGLYKIRNGVPLGISYSSEVSPREFKYLVFSKKRCPICGTRMRKEKKRKKMNAQEARAMRARYSNVNEYYDYYRVEFSFICDGCSRSYTLQELIENS